MIGSHQQSGCKHNIRWQHLSQMNDVSIWLNCEKMQQAIIGSQWRPLQPTESHYRRKLKTKVLVKKVGHLSL